MKQEVVRAVGEILRQLYRLEDIGINPNRLSRLRRETIFFLYEGGGDAKWNPERPHSARARALAREVIGKNITRAGFLKAVTYEHAIPLKTLTDGLRVASYGDEALADFLDRHILGVVLLRSEDENLLRLGLRQVMPSGSEANDRLARYRAAGIEFEPEDLRKVQDGWSIHL